jgi:hypothetical protein
MYMAKTDQKEQGTKKSKEPRHQKTEMRAAEAKLRAM